MFRCFTDMSDGCSNAAGECAPNEESHVLSRPDVGPVATVTGGRSSHGRAKDVSSVQGRNTGHKYASFSQTGMSCVRACVRACMCMWNR